MSNHQLIIGLGGVGGRSVAAFRRTVVAYENDYRFLTEERGTRFEYLYIDSNDDVLNSDIWSIYGKSVKLTPSDFVMLKEGDGTDSIKEISLQENIAPWIGNFAEHFARQIGKSNTGDGSLDSELAGLNGAAQLRRYGRVLFALHAQDIRMNLRNKIAKLTRKSDSDVDVRIFCSLGGGTGSGSIVDMVTLIQSLADDSGHTYRTFIYPFVAGVERDAQDTGSFFLNEYATLRDLNALMVGKYHPYLAGVVGRYTGDNYYHMRRNYPVQAIYISTEVAQGNPNLTAQVDFMAKACFDTVVYGGMFRSPDCMKALSGEDLVQVMPGEPSGGYTLRSYRFAALGSKRWYYPVEEVKDLLKAEYEARVLRSWLRGTALPAAGRDVGKNRIDFSPVGCKTWEAIEKYCRGAKVPLENARKAIEGGEKQTNAPREMNVLSAEIAGKISDALLNSTDVRLEIQRCAREDAANILAMLTEKMDSMFRWNEGGVNTWGIDDVRKYLEEYVCSIPSWESTLTGTMTEQDIENAQEELRNTMNARENEWEEVGIVNRSRKRKRSSECQFEDGVRRVDLALLPFRRQSLAILIEVATNGVRTLLSRIDAVSREMKEHVQRIEYTIHALESDLMTVAKSNMSDISEFDCANFMMVREEIRKLDDEHAMKMARVYSPAWDKVVGSFSNCESGVVGGLLNSLEGAFYDSSKKLHDHAIERNSSLRSVYLSSIFDRFIQLMGGDLSTGCHNWEDLFGEKIDSFVGSLRCSSSIREGGGLTSPQCAPCKTVVFGLPKGAKAYPGFVEWFQARLDKALPSKYRPMHGRMDFFEHNSDGEIRVLYVPYWFPARFAPVVSEIFERYKEAVRNPGERAKIYFANTDDNDIGLVSETRPALTKDGAPDKESMWKVDLACKLYLKHGDQREPLAKADDSGIVMIEGINAHGIAEYGRVYSPEEKAFPSASFALELNAAIGTALEQMNEEEKKAIFGMYTEELKELQKQRESEGMDPDVGDDIEEAKTSRMFVRKWLGLSD